MHAAATTFVIWLCAPAAIATGVRDALLLTAQPCVTPASRLAAPSAISSWLRSGASPARAESARDSMLMSANDTSATATAPDASAPTSASETAGRCGAGRPPGNAPTVATPCSGDRRATSVAASTAINMAGQRGVTRLIRKMAASTATPSRPAAMEKRPSTKACTTRVRLEKTSLPDTGMPKSSGSRPTTSAMAMPFR